MNLPNILLETLPGLADAPGLIGSVVNASEKGVDDRIVYLMVYLYELYPPETMF
tara:strand:- start:554 stop:715 length:162 start_codon:yes stop_codon:yes gene_type:complete